MLSSVNWFNSNNIQQSWDSFYSLHYVITTFVPTKNVTILSHRKKVLLPLFMKRLRSKKLALWRLLRKKPNYNHVKFKFKRAAKALKSTIIKRRLEKESALITPTNKSSFFKYINSKLNINKYVNGLLKDDGTFTSDPFKIAKMFNDYFSSAYTIDNGTNPNFEKRTNSELGSGQSVHHALMKLKRSHCIGPDCIPNVLLKYFRAH